MSRYETKNCPRCNRSFECKNTTITRCQCFNITVKPEVKSFVEQNFDDCLCRECLDYLQQEKQLSKKDFF